MKNKQAEIYRSIAKGFNDLADLAEGATSVVPAPTQVTTAPTTEKATATKTPAPAPKQTEDKTVSGTLSKESLDGMKYNDLKKLAKEMGVEPNGTREAITERLLGVTVSANAEDAKDSEADVPEEKGADLQAQVEEAVAEMSVEEIGDILKEAGIQPTGKRQALIAKLVKAIEEGKIEWDSEDSDSDADGGEDQTDADQNEEAGEEVEDYFPEEGMSEARAEICTELDKELRADYKKKGLSDKEIAETCEAFYLDHEGYDKKLPKGEQLDMYIAATCRMVDDDGEQHEFNEPYEMNGQPACCGHYLNEVDNQLVCPVCGTEYEAE